MATVKSKAAGLANPGLKVASRSMNGFRRHGFTFTPEGVLIPYSKLTQEQVDVLNSEGQLVVAEVDVVAEARRMAGVAEANAPETAPAAPEA